MEPQRDLGLSRRAVPAAFRRVLEALITLVGLVLFTFLLYKILPGSPFDEEVPLHPLVRERLERSWDLHAPWPRQLGNYLAGLAHGDLGVSLTDQRPVSEILVSGLSATLALNLLGLVFMFVVGFVFALGLAWRPHGALFRFTDAFTIAVISVPSLFLGPLLILVFAMKLDWFPAAFLDGPKHYVLPVLTLALRPAGSFGRVLGGALIEVRTADFMRTAKAKGLSDFRALIKHALRNSLVPAFAYIGPSLVWLFSGSFVVELLFAVRGMGSAFVEAISLRDLPVILGLTLFYGALMILVSLVFDLLMKFADPRLQENP